MINICGIYSSYDNDSVWGISFDKIIRPAYLSIIGMSNLIVLSMMSSIIGWSFVISRKVVLLYTTIISCSGEIFSFNVSFSINQPTESFGALEYYVEIIYSVPV